MNPQVVGDSGSSRKASEIIDGEDSSTNTTRLKTKTLKDQISSASTSGVVKPMEPSGSSSGPMTTSEGCSSSAPDEMRSHMNRQDSEVNAVNNRKRRHENKNDGPLGPAAKKPVPPPSHPIPLQSVCSPLAQHFLNSIEDSPYPIPFHDQHFDDRRRRAALGKRRFTGMKFIMTNTRVCKRDVIMELFGDVTMAEESRSGPNEGLKYPPQSHVHCRQKEVIKVDVKFDGRFLSRSCKPNSTLLHFKDPSGGIRFFVVALEDIPAHKEVTLEFDWNFRFSKDPLECAHHRRDMEKCKLEAHRMAVLREFGV